MRFDATGRTLRFAPRFTPRLALHTPRFVATLSAALILGACASLSMAPARTSDGALTDAAGKTLYTFDRDAAASGKSVCNGPCIAIWPAFVAAADASATGDYTVVTRDDGSKQWAYRGKPLYTFSKDTKAGERAGDGFNGNIWHVARP